MNRNDRIFWVTALVLLVVHLGVGHFLRDFEVSADGLEYLRMAEQMLSGRGFTFDGINPVVGKTPGLPAFVALHLRIVGSTAGFQTVQLLLLYSSFVAVALISGKILGRFMAIAVLTALVLIEPLRGLSTNVLSEPLFMALFAWGLYALLHGDNSHRGRSGVMAGLLFGLATYVRPISLFWPAVLVVMVFLVMRSHIKLAIIVLLAQASVVCPWLARNYLTFGEPIPMVSNWGPLVVMTDELLWERFSEKGWVILYENPPFREAIGLEFPFNHAPQSRLRAVAANGWKNDPTGSLWRCVQQVTFAWTYVPGTKEWLWKHSFAFWTGRVVMVIFLLVSILGLISLWQRDRMMALVLGSQAIYTGFLLFPVSTESRYLIPAYLCLIPVTAYGVFSLFTKRLRPPS